MNYVRCLLIADNVSYGVVGMSLSIFIIIALIKIAAFAFFAWALLVDGSKWTIVLGGVSVCVF
jgi:hypothetical protein